MPKKHPSKKTKSSDPSVRLTVVIVGSFLLLLVCAGLLHARSVLPFCANAESCIKDLSGEPSKTNEGVFMGKAVQAPGVPETPAFEIAQARSVLGDTTSNNKHIYVDLSKQRLYAYDGSSLFLESPISSGKWHATPTGDFKIWVWLRATRMAGGNSAAGTYYNLPNVPFTMYFANSQVAKSAGYSLHGAYWHNNFGHPMSHGCVNMIIADAEKVFYWSNPGITGWTTYASANSSGPTITIYGQTPTE